MLYQLCCYKDRDAASSGFLITAAIYCRYLYLKKSGCACNDLGPSPHQDLHSPGSTFSARPACRAPVQPARGSGLPPVPPRRARTPAPWCARTPAPWRARTLPPRRAGASGAQGSVPSWPVAPGRRSSDAPGAGTGLPAERPAPGDDLQQQHHVRAALSPVWQRRSHRPHPPESSSSCGTPTGVTSREQRPPPAPPAAHSSSIPATAPQQKFHRCPEPKAHLVRDL